MPQFLRPLPVFIFIFLYDSFDFGQRYNLVQLFLQNAQSTHLRKMIVDLEVSRLVISSSFSELYPLYQIHDLILSSCWSVACRLLNLTVDLWSARTQQYHMCGHRRVWMMISVDQSSRFQLNLNFFHSCPRFIQQVLLAVLHRIKSINVSLLSSLLIIRFLRQRIMHSY